MKQKGLHIDIIMLSKFGKQDGGRETWLYNFLPELLKDDSIGQVNIFGYRLESENDYSDLLSQQDPLNKNRIYVNILVGTKRKYPKLVSFLFKLRKFTRSYKQPKPDYTLAVGGLHEALLMKNCTRFKKSKNIVWLRTIYTQEKAERIPKLVSRQFKRFESQVLNKIDIVIANGDDTKVYYEKYGLDVKVIKNAIHPQKWKMQPPTLSGKIRIAYIGRLSKVKGIESYLDVVQLIKEGKQASDFEFHVIGEANEFLSKVENFQENNWLKYHGAINNELLPSYMTNIDVCVALSFVSDNLGGAGLSNALLEQMAASKIIIAWDNNAFRQILNESCAYLPEQYSLGELKKALFEINANRDEAVSKAIIATKIVQPYTIKAHVDNFKNLLN